MACQKQPDKPAWPASTKDGPRLDALAIWVEDQMSEAYAQWGDEIFDFDPSAREAQGWLRKSEKAVLLEAFANKDSKNRWRGVAARLRSGKASPRFQAVVADLVEKGGFHSRSVIHPHEHTVLFLDKRLIEKILARDFPEQTKEAIRRMSTRIAADLYRMQIGKVQEVVKGRKDKRRQALSLIRWRVTTEPTTHD